MELDEQSSPLWLVNTRGILIAFAALFLGVWLEATVLTAVAALFVGTALVARAWSRISVNAIECRLELADDRAFPDDRVDLLLTIRSRSIIPIGWIEASLRLPERLVRDDLDEHSATSADGRTIYVMAALLPFRTVRWRWRVTPRARGLYSMRSLDAIIADPLRLFPRRRVFSVRADLLVYPRIVPLEMLGLPVRVPGGDLAMAASRYYDPLRPIAVRDYRPGDARRQIHWKATARRAALQVKVLERTSQTRFSLCLAVETFDHPWLVYRDSLFERAVTAVASLAHAAIDHGGRVSYCASGAEPTRIATGGGVEQLRQILEALAVVAPRKGRTLGSVLATTSIREQGGTTLVIASTELEPDLRAQIAAERVRGMPIVILHCALNELEDAADLEVIELARDSQLAALLATRPSR
jgi:uncharacterized protein (DUF58 family)